MCSDKFYTYIILTEKNTLYCGYTNDLKKRFERHKSGHGAKYTRVFKPVEIVYFAEFDTKSDAMKHEAFIKKMNRKEKEFLISQFNRDELSRLSLQKINIQ